MADFGAAAGYLQGCLVTVWFARPREDAARLLTHGDAVELAIRCLGVSTFGGLAGLYGQPEGVFEGLWHSGRLKEKLCVFGTPLFDPQAAGMLLDTGVSHPGRLVAVRRRAKGISVSGCRYLELPDFAERVGVSIQTVEKWVQSGRLEMIGGKVAANLVEAHRKLVNRQVLSLSELSQRLGVSPEEVGQVAEPCLVSGGKSFYLPGQVQVVKARLTDGLMGMDEFAEYCGIDVDKLGYFLGTGGLVAEKEVCGELYFSAGQADLVHKLKLPRLWRLKKLFS